jgi:hypothetical protein
MKLSIFEKDIEKSSILKCKKVFKQNKKYIYFVPNKKVNYSAVLGGDGNRQKEAHFSDYDGN